MLFDLSIDDRASVLRKTEMDDSHRGDLGSDEVFRVDAPRSLLISPHSFGALVGAPAGVAACWACFWIIERPRSLNVALAISAVIGLICGVAIACRQAKRADGCKYRDIASPICILYALFPALLNLCGIGGVERTVTGLLSLGLAFAFPAIAALIGALLDRLYESLIWRREA